jgi:hypothetical protein
MPAGGAVEQREAARVAFGDAGDGQTDVHGGATLNPGPAGGRQQLPVTG